jgi:predicted ATPase/DNA-binding winged helix-turn-helix (wHTH) protein
VKKAITRESTAPAGQVLAFGPFRLDPARRVLMEADKRIRVGSRAVEILVALAERAGEVVSKKTLIARAWPNSVVGEATLRVQIAALRKALGEGQSGTRYVENVSRRGYRFVAPVSRTQAARSAAMGLAPASHPTESLPTPLTRMVGRAPIISALAARLQQRRFVTIVGPGGIGKTTVALAVAQKFSTEYRYGVSFVDLALISDPQRVSSALAAALGLAILAEDPLVGILAALKGKPMLIVLDNCEHVIQAAASLAENVLRETPEIRLLATSREPLRAEGEAVHRLLPLEAPPPTATLARDEALAFPAVQLFVERAVASLHAFGLRDEDVPAVAEICRRLDGNPLAIELAAARVDLFGVRGLAERLDDRLQLLTRGRRTALPRHQTLRATLDWSYELLSPVEQMVLRRVAVFAGSFDLESACAVVVDAEIGPAAVFDSLVDLTAKSLITADSGSDEILYRLLDTPRNYALEKLQSSLESPTIRRRHAELCCTWGAGASDRETPSRKIDDVRVALGWCFSAGGDAALGVRLTAASAPLWSQLSLLDEHREHAERALRIFNRLSMPDATLELQLTAALGDALIHTKGPGPEVTAAYHKVLELAQRLGLTAYQRRALWGLWHQDIHAADYRSAVSMAEQFRLVSQNADDQTLISSDRMLALANYFAGNTPTARRHVERALSEATRTASQPSSHSFQFDTRVTSRALLARVLWTQGFASQAIRVAREGVEIAQSAGHVLSLCYLLTGVGQVALWTGDIPFATRVVNMLIDHAGQHSLGYWLLWGRCLDMALSLRNGDLRVAPRLDFLPDDASAFHYLEHLATFDEELVSPEAMARAEEGRAGWSTAEILRAKGEIILRAGGASAASAAEALFRRSLETARRQNAVSWELRAATSLARLWHAQGRAREGHDLLAPVYARFTEGFETADLKAAQELLDALAVDTLIRFRRSSA